MTAFVPVGQDSLSYQVECILLVYDSVGSSSSMTSSIVVEPLSKHLSGILVYERHFDLILK